MSSLIAAAKAFVSDEEGITAIEYGLIAAVMAAAIAGIFGLLTTALETGFTKIAGLID